jgi:HEPN domain-containing protein
MSRAEQQVVNFDLDNTILGLHAKLAVEKALKALLTHLGIYYGRTHDVEELRQMVSNAGTKLPDTPISLDHLNGLADEYFSEEPEDCNDDKSEMRDTVRTILDFVDRTVGLSM